MRKHIVLLISCSIALSSSAQTVTGKLQFEQGKTYNIAIELKNTIAQQAMGNAIDFTVSGTAGHSFKVTNTTDDNTTLHHTMDRLNFDFEGMGQKRSFNSANQKDMDGQFGAPIKELLAKAYDLIVDGNGTTLMSMPEKIELTKQDERLAIISNMLKDLTSAVYPPQKASPSFFAVLPNRELKIGDTWRQSVTTANDRTMTDYTLTAISDSVITVDFKTTSASIIKSQMMGMETTTNMNSTAIGKIFLDRSTNIIKEKNITIESNGTTEAMNTSMPISSKMIMTIRVNAN